MSDNVKTPEIGETLNIIQHPKGKPKQVALRENTITRILLNFFNL